MTEEEWDRVVDINLKGTFFICRYAIPELLKTRGCIINIGSDAGVVGNCRVFHLLRCQRGCLPAEQVPGLGVGALWSQGQCGLPGGCKHPHARKSGPAVRTKGPEITSRICWQSIPRVKWRDILPLRKWPGPSLSGFTTSGSHHRHLPVHGFWTHRWLFTRQAGAGSLKSHSREPDACIVTYGQLPFELVHPPQATYIRRLGADTDPTVWIDPSRLGVKVGY